MYTTGAARTSVRLTRVSVHDRSSESDWIYHITHINNSGSILSDDGLLSDAEMINRGGPAVAVGMSKIKPHRMRHPVNCQEGDTVGEYVPFYFCPRSIMLYILYRGNHPGLTYRGGQGPIIHLEANARRGRMGGERRRPMGVQLANAGAL